jgi:multicomponent Na+:H+ antiporter subunit F
MTQSIWLILTYLSLSFIIIAFVCCFIRMMKGPILPDRVVALDLTANLLISFIALFSVITHQAVYIDVIVALALIIFLTTVAFANLITWQAKRAQIKKIKEHL